MKDLKLEIDSTNSLKEFSTNVITAILPKLTQFIGKKIFLADGSRAKILDIEMKEFQPKPIDGIQHVQYLTAKYGKLRLEISLCLSGGSHDVKPSTAFCKYAHNSYDLGTCEKGQILTSLETLEKIVQEYNLNERLNVLEELRKIREYKQLQSVADNAKKQIKISESFYKFID